MTEKSLRITVLSGQTFALTHKIISHQQHFAAFVKHTADSENVRKFHLTGCFSGVVRDIVGSFYCLGKNLLQKKKTYQFTTGGYALIAWCVTAEVLFVQAR